MFKKLRVRIARLIPFMKWVAKDVESGNLSGAQDKVIKEVLESAGEVKTEIKNV